MKKLLLAIVLTCGVCLGNVKNPGVCYPDTSSYISKEDGYGEIPEKSWIRMPPMLDLSTNEYVTIEYCSKTGCVPRTVKIVPRDGGTILAPPQIPDPLSLRFIFLEPTGRPGAMNYAAWTAYTDMVGVSYGTCSWGYRKEE